MLILKTEKILENFLNFSKDVFGLSRSHSSVYSNLKRIEPQHLETKPRGGGG